VEESVVSENKDVKVLFLEGKQVRKLMGEIENEDDFFVYLKRRDGNFRIAKKYIIKIEDLNSRSGSENVQ
jgi:hypothetical protein